MAAAKRNEGEKFEDYRERLTELEKQTKEKMAGKLVWSSVEFKYDEAGDKFYKEGKTYIKNESPDN